MIKREEKRLDPSAAAPTFGTADAVPPQRGRSRFFMWNALALVLHDVMVNRRVHPATTWGIVTIFGSLILFGVVVPSTSFGRIIVLELAAF